jgi:hypothetical protein
MTQERRPDERVRKNISLLQSVIDIGDGLVLTLHKSSFSQLLTDLILEAHRRHTSREDTSLAELLEDNRKLKAKIEGLKGDPPAKKLGRPPLNPKTTQ